MDPDAAHRLQWLLEHRCSSRVPYDPGWRVTEGELAAIVDAARWAPTADNLQNFRLVVVDDRRLLDALRLPIAGAPMAILTAFDPTLVCDPLGLISLGCVLENMWLAAQAARLDAQVLVTADDVEPGIRTLCGIPEPWRIAFVLRIGHAIHADHSVRVRRLPTTFVGRNRFA